ncbi:MAG: hypothetical protein WCA95_03610 [Opitutaceae bacterium]
MQTLVTVVAKPGVSLRDVIVNDPKLSDFDLYVESKKDPQRSHGWAKLYSPTAYGAINVQWLGNSNLLLCRVVTKGSSTKSATIIGHLTEYLLTRQHRRLLQLHISRV